MKQMKSNKMNEMLKTKWGEMKWKWHQYKYKMKKSQGYISCMDIMI